MAIPELEEAERDDSEELRFWAGLALQGAGEKPHPELGATKVGKR